MKFISAVLMVLAAVGALAKPQSNVAYQSNGFNCFSQGYGGSSVPVLNAHLQTSTVENPPVNFPGLISPSTISEACHCLQTLVRPQLRNDIITVPAVDRIVRTVATPVVETVNCGGTTRLVTFNPTNTIQTRPEGGRGSTQGSPPIGTNAFYTGGTTNHNSNSFSTGGGRAIPTLVATPTSVYTYHAGGTVSGCKNAYTGSTGYSNTGRITL